MPAAAMTADGCFLVWRLQEFLFLPHPRFDVIHRPIYRLSLGLL